VNYSFLHESVTVLSFTRKTDSELFASLVPYADSIAGGKFTPELPQVQ